METAMRTTEILAGKLSFPKQIVRLTNMTEEQQQLVDEYWGAVWHAFLNEEGVNALYWSEIFHLSGHDKLFRQVNYYLAKFGWIEMETSMGFCLIRLLEDKILQWVCKAELRSVRKLFRLRHYKMRLSIQGFDDLVKIGNGRKRTGIIRKGFAKAGKHRFSYDCRAIRKYQKEITAEVSKKLVAGIKDVDYKAIVAHLIAEYATEPGTYTLGANTSDSRGRAIFDCTKRVFNPISHKTARAVVTLPKAVRLTSEGEEAIYAFVAELNGLKKDTWADKIAAGKEACDNRLIADGVDLHERIWLERIYDNIDRYQADGWDTPISADVTACGLAILGTLTNDHHFLDGTNVIGEKLKDIWTVPGLTRNQVKKAITPILYGSSQTPEELWDGHDYSYSQKQANLINRELFEGRFQNVLKFKEHVIGKVQPQKKMRVKLWNDEFDIYCNRFKWGVTTPVKYEFLDGRGRLKTVVKETELEPDLQAFKLYFATLCLHGLDSQIANYVCEHVDWVIPIHDDFIASPNDIPEIRRLYVEKLRELYVNRHQVLHDFCQSIGIEEDYEDINDKALDVDTFSGHCLK